MADVAEHHLAETYSPARRIVGYDPTRAVHLAPGRCTCPS